MTTILLPCNEQLEYKDNLLETIVNLFDLYSLNFWRILSGGLSWSSPRGGGGGVLLSESPDRCVPLRV